MSSAAESEIDAKVAALIHGTMVCSFHHHMQMQPCWEPVLTLGNAAVPSLLRALERGDGGMAVIHMLHEITGETPDHAAHELEDGWVKTTVADAVAAWVAWGRERGHLE